MANFNIDDEGLWGSSNEVSGLEPIGLNALSEECLMQNVKNANYVLSENDGNGVQPWDAIFSGEIDDFPQSWDPQELFSDSQITTNFPAHQNEKLEHVYLASQNPTATGNGSSGPQLQVLTAALPINIQQHLSPIVEADVKTSLEEFDLISTKVGLKFDEFAAGSHTASPVLSTAVVATQQVQYATAASSAVSNSVHAGKKAPRRRRNNFPKEKLYMRTEPFSDDEEEKKRQNAVKAYRNRQRHSTKINQLKDENQELKRLLQEKVLLIQEKDDLIKAFHEGQKQKNKTLITIKSELSKLIMN